MVHRSSSSMTARCSSHGMQAVRKERAIAGFWCAIQLAGGTSWEPTQIAVNPRECAAESWFSNKTLGNTVLFQDKENIVWLFYAAVEFGGWSGAHVDYKISRDRGRTWSESHRLTNGLGDIPRSKPVELGPARTLSATVAFCFMEVSQRRAIGNRQRKNRAKDVFPDR